VEHVDWTKIRDMSATAVLTAVAVWLVRYSDSDSVLVTNHLTALILIVAIAALIVSMQKKDL
jgi:Flp pilus assembly protein protease CpaA